MKQYWSKSNTRKEKDRNSRNTMLQRKETLEKLKNSAEDVEGKVEESSQSMGLTTADNASVKSLKNLDLNSSNR